MNAVEGSNQKWQLGKKFLLNIEKWWVCNSFIFLDFLCGQLPHLNFLTHICSFPTFSDYESLLLNNTFGDIASHIRCCNGHGAYMVKTATRFYLSFSEIEQFNPLLLVFPLFTLKFDTSSHSFITHKYAGCIKLA